MPGCLFYFCAEWQRSRKVLSPSAQSLQDFIDAVGPAGEIHHSSTLAKQHGLQGWVLDTALANETGLQFCSEVHQVGSEESTNRLESCSRSASKQTMDGAPSPDSPTAASESPVQRGASKRNPRLGSLFLGALLTTPPTSHASSRALMKHHTPGRLRTAPSNIVMAPCADELTASVRRAGRQLVSPNPIAPTPARPTSPRHPAPPTPRSATPIVPSTPLTFLNPAHPFFGLPRLLSKDDFVQEVRRRLRVERLFETHTSAGRALRNAVLSVDEAEDIFEALLLLQTPAEGSNLQTGKELDTAVERFFVLRRLRTVIERSSQSFAAFFKSLDLDDDGLVEVTELQHFLKNSDGAGAAAALAAGGIDSGSLAGLLLDLLDTDGNGKVELGELRRQMALVAQPGASLVALCGHLEMKHGLGRAPLGKAALPAAREQSFNYFCQDELLDVAPEDVLRCSRIWQPLGKGIPLEIAWGLVPRVTDQFFSALGARVLQQERALKRDSNLPPEALLEVLEGNRMPEPSEMRARFDRLWNRCLGEKGPWRSGGASSSSSSGAAAAQLREGCFTRYVEAAQKIVDARGSAGPRSLFFNVGDVLAVASSCLPSGRACVIRYRLMGASNFWHPEHQVLKNERESVLWPVPRKVLGETPFVGIVPRGLRWTSAGGGGFYLGTQSFTQVDPGLRADLPCDPETGLPLLFGHVEIIAPFLFRSAKSEHFSSGHGVVEDFELRLFCSRKHKIIGCIGEALQVRVEQQTPPLPLATLQVCCDGNRALLRWAALDLGPRSLPTHTEAVSLRIHSSHLEQTHSLDPGTTSWEIPDLSPDTEYEFRVRLVNRAGIGREATATCRTNSRCSAPMNLTNTLINFAHSEIRWSAPEIVGNEVTKDRFQVRGEAIERYEAELRVEEPGDAAHPVRTCWWQLGSWSRDPDGSLTAQLAGLSPDTLYCLEKFRAINSMGAGPPAKTLRFWTPPHVPQISQVRVRHGMVLIALSQLGGHSVSHYRLNVALASRPAHPQSFTVPRCKLQEPPTPGGEPELALALEQMPHAAEPREEHHIQLQAMNAGNCSEFGERFATVAVARQQGANQAELALVSAIKAREIEQLARVLQDVRDIEFHDNRQVVAATELLQTLEAAQRDLTEAMNLCDPFKLREALQRAREVKLLDIQKAEDQLQVLQQALEMLQNAQGIDAFRQALKAGHEAKLPTFILQEAVTHLGTREAAQEGLQSAMEAARVPVLAAALASAEGMHLPAERSAREMLERLKAAETQLRAALKSGQICDLGAALDCVSSSGLREDTLIKEASDVHARLITERDARLMQLDKAMEARYPEELDAALESAAAAQIPKSKLQVAQNLLQKLNGILLDMASAVGVADRSTALQAAYAAGIPRSLLAAAEDQVESLQALLGAQERGDIMAMRHHLKLAGRAKVKEEEVLKPKQLYAEWSLLTQRVEFTVSIGDAQRLHTALADALAGGVDERQLDGAQATLRALEGWDRDRDRLRQAIAARRCEELQQALRAASDASLEDRPLFQAAHAELRHLLQRRVGLAAAMQTADLRSVHSALRHAREPPELPGDELTAGEEMLRSLQGAELGALTGACLQARGARDFRSLDACREWAGKAAALGVTVDKLGLDGMEALSLECQKEVQAALAYNLHLEREGLKPERPSPPGVTIEERDLLSIPFCTVTGEVQLAYASSGDHLLVLPRDVVHGTVSVAVADEPGELGVADDSAAQAACEMLVGAIASTLDQGDIICRLSEYIVEDDGAHRRVDLHVAVYLQGCRSGVQIVEALHSSGLSGLVAGASTGGPHPGASTSSARAPSSSVTGLRRYLDGLEHSAGPDVPLRAGCVKDLRTRELRRITLGASWTCPEGVLDAFDCACTVYAGDHLLDVLDVHGQHGSQYHAVDTKGAWLDQRGLDGAMGAVQDIGGMTDIHARAGKLQVVVRLDILPIHASDLAFVLTCKNASEFSSFEAFEATVTNTDSGEVLTTYKLDSPGMSAEAIVALVVSRLHDGLWHVFGANANCRWTGRNYRPILDKLREIGLPRSGIMQAQIPGILDAMRQRLELPRPLNCTSVNMDDVHALGVGYAIEVADGDKSMASAEDLVKQISQLDFHEHVSTSVGSSTGNRFMGSHLSIASAAVAPFLHVAVDICWEGADLQHADERRHLGSGLLDGACVVFAGTVLLEVVDYQGAHGVRLVHNGVYSAGGTWVGKYGLGDATNGAVRHAGGGAADRLSSGGRSAFEVRLDRLPPAASDLFFVASSPLGQGGLGGYELCLRLRNAGCPGHELCSEPMPRMPLDSEAMLVCRLARQGGGDWKLSALGSPARGNARDYQPLLAGLRAFQQGRPPQEPMPAPRDISKVPSSRA